MSEDTFTFVLRNGAEVEMALATAVFAMVVNTVRNISGGELAIRELERWCRDPGYEWSGASHRVLREAGLIDRFGMAPDYVKDVVLSSVQNSGEKITLVIPVEEDE